LNNNFPDITRRYSKLLKELGANALNSLHPDEFEYYLCAFELVSGIDTIQYFIFPIQPSSISIIDTRRTNIKRSMSGITVLRNNTFNPKTIELKGNFGKRFKILMKEGVAFGGDSSSSIKGTVKKPQFSADIKTGYGACKLFQKILEDSNKVSPSGEPNKLYFYNMAFGESYLVEVNPQGTIFSNTEDQNMIWQYSVSMTAVAMLEDVLASSDFKSSKKLLNASNIQNITNIVASDIMSYFSVNGLTKQINHYSSLLKYKV
jgi:hypothetical protein